MSQTASTNADVVTNAATPGVAEYVVMAQEGEHVVLNAVGTKYEVTAQAVSAMGIGSRVMGLIRARGRKVWTIPAGGSFVTPLLGQPRVIQGRVKAVQGETIVVQAGFPICVELPEGKSSRDLKNGPLRPGVLVNVTVWPGVKFETA